jgi:hypothetical protein
LIYDFLKITVDDYHKTRLDYNERMKLQEEIESSRQKPQESVALTDITNKPQY